MANRTRRPRRGSTKRAHGGARGRRRPRGSASLARARRGYGALLSIVWLALLLILGWSATPESRRPRLALPGAGLDARGSWARLLHREPEPIEPLWIDPARLAQSTPAEWGWPAGTDERWAEELGAEFASTPEIPVAPPGAALPVALGERQRDLVDDLHGRLEALSFVASVPVLGVDAERGLDLALVLREPVACVPVGNGFVTVDAEGVLLSGSWPTPVRIEGLPLPVIGPMADAHGIFARGRPGDWLSEPEHLDALDVAVSLKTHLGPQARRALGRCVIDARTAREASVTEPGVRLLLEGRRLVLFGRRPATPEPGELAVSRKWDSVRRALAPLTDPADPFDWDVVDVRWDRPAFVPRGPMIAQGTQTTERGRDAARPH